jgi:pyrroline-5-carboxylate reductase
MRIAVVGVGVMGEAIVSALLRNGTASLDQIYAAEYLAERCSFIGTKYGVRVTQSALEAVKDATMIIIATKPQKLDSVFADIRAAGVAEDVLVFSICAGVTIARFVEGCGNPNQRVIRAMPNTPAQIGKGISAWTSTDNLSESQRAAGKAILGAMGDEVFVSDEHQLDMSTALSGSCPAYVLMFMEAVIDAGVHMGVARPVARRLVMQTIRGTAEYAIHHSNVHVAQLRNQVTSPGGTTAAALYQLEKGGLRMAVFDAVWAAFERAQELGRDSTAPCNLNRTVSPCNPNRAVSPHK